MFQDNTDLPLFRADHSIPRVLSLGMGVDSSTLALMAARGEIPAYDCAVFADTGHEPKQVHDWIAWLTAQVAKERHPFPIYTVKASTTLEHDALTLRPSVKDGGQRMLVKAGIPWFTKDANGKRGKMMRNCTFDKKIAPIRVKLRELFGISGREQTVRIELHIGIAWDEIQRVKPSDAAWATHQWPLASKKMTRADCLKWFAERGYPSPPRSACEFCPFHSNSEWKRLIAHDPTAFERAVKFEREFQSVAASTGQFKSVPYLHSACKPLDQVDFNAPKKSRPRKVAVPAFLHIEDGRRPEFVLVGENPDECGFE